MFEHDFSACLTAGDIDTRCVASTLQGLPAERLPLSAACNHGGIVAADSLRASAGKVTTVADAVVIEVAVFFDELLGGCNCSDDPAAITTYAELLVTIDVGSGSGRVVARSDAGTDLE